VADPTEPSLGETRVPAKGAPGVEQTRFADGSEPGPRDEAHPQPEPVPGDVVGRYVVLSRLGAGAMGVVLAAYDPELDRKIALKLLKPRASGDRATAQSRLQREAQALAKLSHPSVVGVHDVGVHESRVFLAMEFIEGRTLGQWLEAGGRSWQEIVEVFAAAGRGLEAAHAQGLIHRDFKPENVMVGADGRVRVMDFGLARADTDDVESSLPPDAEDDTGISTASALSTRLTRTGAVMGTPAYMAPEQFQRRELDARTDQFAYCVALYEALYRTRPFEGKTLGRLVLAVTEGSVVTPPRNTDVPGWLAELVMRGLRPGPEDRFADMTELLAAFGRGEERWHALDLGRW
jgi:serine/threonine protein kinase